MPSREIGYSRRRASIAPLCSAACIFKSTEWRRSARRTGDAGEGVAVHLMRALLIGARACTSPIPRIRGSTYFRRPTTVISRASHTRRRRPCVSSMKSEIIGLNFGATLNLFPGESVGNKCSTLTEMYSRTKKMEVTKVFFLSARGWMYRA